MTEYKTYNSMLYGFIMNPNEFSDMEKRLLRRYVYNTVSYKCYKHTVMSLYRIAKKENNIPEFSNKFRGIIEKCQNKNLEWMINH